MVATDGGQLSWTTVDSETAYSCGGFDVVSQHVLLPDGTETAFDYLSEPPAVVILPFTPDDDVVVIDEWRQAVERVNRGLPAGTVEPGDEELSTAARRELREETGYEADSVKRLMTAEPANGVANSVHHYFLARGCTPTAKQDLDGDESIRVTTTDVDELRRAALDGELRDGRAITAICYWSLAEGEGDSSAFDE